MESQTELPNPVSNPEPDLLVYLRFPFPRNGFKDPPPHSWGAAKEEKLWLIISDPVRRRHADWPALAAELRVPVPFLLKQVAWLYRRELISVHNQLKEMDLDSTGHNKGKSVADLGQNRENSENLEGTKDISGETAENTEFTEPERVEPFKRETAETALQAEKREYPKEIVERQEAEIEVQIERSGTLGSSEAADWTELDEWAAEDTEYHKTVDSVTQHLKSVQLRRISKGIEEALQALKREEDMEVGEEGEAEEAEEPTD